MNRTNASRNEVDRHPLSGSLPVTMSPYRHANYVIAARFDRYHTYVWGFASDYIAYVWLALVFASCLRLALAQPT